MLQRDFFYTRAQFNSPIRIAENIVMNIIGPSSDQLISQNLDSYLDPAFSDGLKGY